MYCITSKNILHNDNNILLHIIERCNMNFMRTWFNAFLYWPASGWSLGQSVWRSLSIKNFTHVVKKKKREEWWGGCSVGKYELKVNVFALNLMLKLYGENELLGIHVGIMALRLDYKPGEFQRVTQSPGIFCANLLRTAALSQRQWILWVSAQTHKNLTYSILVHLVPQTSDITLA